MLVDPIHVARLPAEVHRHDGPGPRRDGALAALAGSMFSVSGSQSTSTGVGAEIRDDLGRGRERHGRHDDFVVRRHADGFQRQVQAGGARVDRNRMLGADGSGERRPRTRAPAAPVVSQPDRSVFDDRADFGLADVRQMKRQERASITANGCWAAALQSSSVNYEPRTLRTGINPRIGAMAYVATRR